MVETPLFSPVAADAVYVKEVKDAVTEVNVPEPTAEVTTETVAETPAVEVETPVVAEPPAPTTVEVIKEVEKIVEKYPEMDEYTSELFTALMEGKEDVLYNYLSEKNKDYKSMSDYDVVKEGLRKANPTWSNDDLDLKIEVQYGELARIDLSKISEENSPEEYAEAVAHNARVDRNAKVLKLDALNHRATLDAAKKEIKLPKIAKEEAVIVPQPTAEEIEQGRISWEAQVAQEIPLLKEFTFKVGEKGDEDVSYAVTDQERAAELAFFKELSLPNMLDRLGWKTKDGKQDIQKMAGDALKLKNLPAIIAAAYTQGHTAGAKGIKADIKNIDLSTNNSSTATGAVQDLGLLAFGHLNK